MHSEALWMSVSGSSMLLMLLCWFVGVTVLLYFLYSWLIPAVVQFNGSLALLWHDVIVERALDTLTRSTRPQVTQSGLDKPFSITTQNYSMFFCPTSTTGMHNGKCDPKSRGGRRCKTFAAHEVKQKSSPELFMSLLWAASAESSTEACNPRWPSECDLRHWSFLPTQWMGYEHWRRERSEHWFCIPDFFRGKYIT